MKNVWQVIKGKWLSYRFRFVPWVALNLKEKIHRSVGKENDKILNDHDIESRLLCFCKSLHEQLGKPQNSKCLSTSQEAMEQSLGYAIERRTSNISGAGKGVFVSRGKVSVGSIVALYPGTIYRVMEPLLLQSISNTFIFRCIDGLHIDGKDRGISCRIFKSCVYRDLRWTYFPADLSWLSNKLVNPLNCGQYVNNENPEFPSNVAYQECDLSLENFPIELRCYLPNIYYSNSENYQRNDLRIVVLVATRDIEKDSELFSTYYTIVHG